MHWLIETPPWCCYLFEGSSGGEQVEDHVGRHTDEGGDPDTVAQDSGPRWVVVVKEPHLRGEGQEADDDELGRWRTLVESRLL